MLTSREIASLMLIGLLAVLILSIPRWRRDVLPAFVGVFRAAIAPSILAVFGLFLLWCGVWISVGVWLGYWNLSLLKDTLIIVVTVGFPLLFRSINARSGIAIVRQLGKETVALSALLLFYLNLAPFPLWLELIVQPAMTFLLLLQFASSREARNRQVHSCLSVAIALVGIAVLVWSTLQIVLGAPDRDWASTISELALSIWFPLTMFPFFYGVTFYAAAQKITRRMRRIHSPPASRRSTLAAVLGLRFRLRWAREFLPIYERKVSRAATFRAALAEMRTFREQVIRNEERKADRLADLEGFTGQTGADGTGAQLDRREFEGTKRALEFLALAQGLRYERLGNIYWDDLTDMVLEPLSRYGLPDAHGVSVELTTDRQRWRAWRRVPNGWVLGIGGRDGRPGHYLYSAGVEPNDWPGDDGWTDATWSPELPPDWARDDRPHAYSGGVSAPESSLRTWSGRS